MESRKLMLFLRFFSRADIVEEFVKYPTMDADRAEIARGFQRSCNIPSKTISHDQVHEDHVSDIMGAADGTIIEVHDVRGTAAFKHSYRPRNSKQFSINILIVCDHRGKVLHFDANSPGRYTYLRVDLLEN